MMDYKEQREWLQEYLPQYMTEHLKDKNYSHFWPVLNAEWFKWLCFLTFPLILFQQRKILQWTKLKSSAKCPKKESTVFNDMLQPKRRAKSKAEIYSDIYYNKRIKPLVKAEEEVGNLLEDEDEDVKAQVHKMYEQQWRTHENAAKTNVLDDDEGDCMLDAEAITQGIDDLSIICQ
ncbi:uncharacterized protein F5891DRAFT_980558 [Suillus fuscotomentosus]|uniref:Uncharacterized protein n=1 Tax=Suillus fuscotomentosus TaxID=1912939 RepID=A0AAD4E548_9AGAM|nr:uncharacterized protein F5891DRAFT_980558 [Suillus fuscotomentosus]KAG1899918.1 hypothetical protein F5891DRAFT_980558 [Suillus fuscotomentosus]